MWKMRRVRELSNIESVQKYEQEEGEMWGFRGGRVNRESEEECQTSEFCTWKRR